MLCANLCRSENYSSFHIRAGLFVLYLVQLTLIIRWLIKHNEYWVNYFSKFILPKFRLNFFLLLLKPTGAGARCRLKYWWWNILFVLTSSDFLFAFSCFWNRCGWSLFHYHFFWLCLYCCCYFFRLARTWGLRHLYQSARSWEIWVIYSVEL